MIRGVRTKSLRMIPDERGRVMEVLRADDDLFLKFGQVYITTTYPHVVKAWHYHKVQTDHICAIQGMIKLVLYDPREGSRPKGRSMNSSSASTTLCWFKCPTGSITDGNASARKKPSYSTSRRRSTFTARRMSTVFHLMGRISLMIGREKMDNNCPHRAEGIAHSVQSFYAMPYALCALQFVDWSE